MAEPRLVTDPKMCGLDPIDSLEMGMSLTATEMFEIEYFCAFAEPVDLTWNTERVVSRIGYCSEPGLMSPQVWALELSPDQPGEVTVWWQGVDEPTIFVSCPE